MRTVEAATSETTRRALPARSSRGTRIRKLVGEEAEADESFWNQNAWNEDEEDDDYSTEEGMIGRRMRSLSMVLMTRAWAGDRGGRRGG